MKVIPSIALLIVIVMLFSSVTQGYSAPKISFQPDNQVVQVWFTASPQLTILYPPAYLFSVEAKTSSGFWITNLHWDFGDGSTLDVAFSGQSQVSDTRAHQYVNQGNYIVTVTATDNAGNIGTSTVTVYPQTSTTTTATSLTTIISSTPTASITNFQSPPNTTIGSNARVTLTVPYDGMLSGDHLLVIIEVDEIILPNGTAYSPKDNQMTGVMYSSPDTCVPLPADESAAVGNNTLFCDLSPRSLSGSENLVFTLQFKSANTTYSLRAGVATFSGDQLSTVTVLAVKEFSIVVAPASTPTVSITNLQSPSNALVGSKVTVALTVTYEGVTSRNTLIVGLVNKSVTSGTIPAVNGTATSSPDTCMSLAGTSVANYAACYLSPASPSGSETITFNFSLPFAKPYNLTAEAAVTLGSTFLVNSTFPFSIVVSTSGQSTFMLATTVASGQGAVSPVCASGCSESVGSSVSVQAIPSANWQFSAWSITGASCSGGPTSNPCTFTMPNNAVTVFATFTQITTNLSYLSINFDKTLYHPGETVHISGGIETPSCTWGYFNFENSSVFGLSVNISITDPNGVVLTVKSSQTAVGYKSYAYGYTLPANAVEGIYSVAVSYPEPCGMGTIHVYGTFRVQAIYPWAISVSTDKQTYQTNETIRINGTLTGGPIFYCSAGSTCTSTTGEILGEVTVFNASGKYPVTFQDLAFTPTNPPIYHFQTVITWRLPPGAYSADAEAGAVGYPNIHATTNFTVVAGVNASSPRCVIATATFGSEVAPEVQLLRNFRDNSIMKTRSGYAFMLAFNAWYYSFSPTVASYLQAHWVERTIMKGVLYPLIGIMWLSSATFNVFRSSPEVAVLFSGLLASSLLGAFYVGLPLGVLSSRIEYLRRHRKQKLLQSTLIVMLLVGFGTLIIGELFALGSMLIVSTLIIVLSTLCLSATITSDAISKRLQDYLQRHYSGKEGTGCVNL